MVSELTAGESPDLPKLAPIKMGCAEFNLCHLTTNLTLVQWSSKLYNENSQRAAMVLSICHPKFLRSTLSAILSMPQCHILGVWQPFSLACTEGSEPQNIPHTHPTSQLMAFSRPFVGAVFRPKLPPTGSVCRLPRGDYGSWVNSCQYTPLF